MPEILREAFLTARSGKPGPVLIDLPLDVQNADIDYDPATYVPASYDAPAPDSDKIRKAIEMISAAKKPLLLMGGGVIPRRCGSASASSLPKPFICRSSRLTWQRAASRSTIR